MKSLALIAVLLVTAAPRSAVQIEAAAPASAWRPVASGNLLLVDTAKGQLAIELAPQFAPAHVAAIRALVRAGAFAGGAVVRVQDNYVVQFAAREPQLTAGSKLLPGAPPAPAKRPALMAEYDQPAADVAFTPLPGRDAYAAQAGFSDGWPVARQDGRLWPVHCYAMVGVGRDNPPDTGDGSELYAVIGHAPRHLDRNLAVVGRVVAGIEPFAALPRGTEALGFYKTPAERLPIIRATIAADLIANARPQFEAMRTDTPTFAAYLDARANRRDVFFVRPAGAVDVCNVRVPVRRVPGLR